MEKKNPKTIENRIRELFPFALSEFNERMDSDLSPELVLVNRKNIISVFNDLIIRIHALREPISSPSYLNGLAAEALVGERGGKAADAILFRTDLQTTNENIFHTLLHELSHIYCIRNEYKTERGLVNFNAENCRDEDNEFLLTGYGVWKEYIAEYLACGIGGFVPTSLQRRKKTLMRLVKHIRISDPKYMGAMADYLVGVLTSQEALSAWSVLEADMEKRSLPYVDVIRLVYRHTEEKSYKIDPLFISELGSMIVFQMAMEEWKRAQNPCEIV